MKITIQSILAILLMMDSAATLCGPINAEDNSQYQEKFELQLVIGLFMDAVENNEIKLFDIPLTKDMIEIEKVAYVYDLRTDKNTINIHCSLTTHQKLPQNDAFYIDGFTVYINSDGAIETITAHVRPF
jgi:hypothetical protein